MIRHSNLVIRHSARRAPGRQNDTRYPFQRERIPGILSPMARNGRWAVWVLRALAGVGLPGLAIIGFLNLSNPEADPDKRAIVAMGLGLVAIWCIGGGILMRLARDRVVGLVRRVKIPWQVSFVVFGLVLILVEEAVTTALTNAAPLLGSSPGAAAITASPNYLEVVIGRMENGEWQAGTGVIFVFWLICWAWMLSRWNFRPAEVMLCFGLTGAIAEVLFSGPIAIPEAPMWVYVYGLMVYLPVRCIPPARPAERPPWWLWPIAVLLPLVFIIPLTIWLIAMAVWRPVCIVRRRHSRTPSAPPPPAGHAKE